MAWLVGGGPTGRGDTLSGGYSRTELLAERVGWSGAIGGLYGPEVLVTNVNDSGAGSLRDACAATGPAWLRFHPDLDGEELRLLSACEIGPDKTIDGRGAAPRITSYGPRFAGDNAIITDIQVDFRDVWMGDTDPLDGPFAFNGQAHVDVGYPVYDQRQFWVHHCTFIGLQVGDGSYVDVLDEGICLSRRVRRVTVSWCRFERMNKCILIGTTTDTADNSGDDISIHHNYFDRNEERQPLVRFSRNLHVFNNVYRDWGGPAHGLCVSVGDQARVLHERNVMDSGYDRLGVTVGAAANPSYHATGNLTTSPGGTVIPADVNPNVVPLPRYPYTPDTADATLRALVAAGAGRRS